MGLVEMSLFEETSAWQVFASGLAEGTVEAVAGKSGTSGLRLRYDFHGGSGYIAIRRLTPWRMPSTFRLHLEYRGEGPANHLECKVCAPGGINVWRNQRLNAELGSEWRAWSLTERDLSFAWGPAGGGPVDLVEALELVVVAGPGGKGHVDFCDFRLTDETLIHPAAITASSEKNEYSASAVFVDDHGEWIASPDDPQPWWSLDFGRTHRFGGLIIEWPEDLPPRAFQVEISNNSRDWHTIHRAQGADGSRTHIPTPKMESRYLRLRFDHPECAALRAVRLQPDAFSHSPNEFMHAVARDFPRGWHPRYWHREQSFWTPVGSPDGGKRALINEEGMVEVDEGGFSLEPFLMTPDGLLTWADMNGTAELTSDGLPMPQVILSHRDTTCEITPWMDHAENQPILRVRYRWKMATPQSNRKFAIAVRPFQVTPPWQAFRNLGGISPIVKIDPKGDDMRIDGKSIYVTPAAHEQGAACMEQGGVLAYLARGACPPREEIVDASQLASGAWVWHIPDLASQWEVTVSVPYEISNHPPVHHDIAATEQCWREVLGKVQWSVPECAKPAFDCWKTCAGHILINRDGAGFQPGPRRYSRTWIRDSVIMGAALAKTGIAAPLRDFIEWYAPFQREDGFVPCVVDRDGIDWLVEHDSHGQFLWGMRESYHYQKDDAFLSSLLSSALKAADYLLFLRHQRTTSYFQNEEQRAKYGLLPESASHEGYLAHPVHSYWDDFWGIRGLEACADLCQWSGREDEAHRWRKEAKTFRNDTLHSMELVIARHDLHFLPGSVEWADFDPTATANAVALLDFADLLPAAPLREMLTRYLSEQKDRQSGEIAWSKYSAYEIRIVGALVRMGEREEAQRLLSFFLSDRRPRAWNQWPEITWHDPRAPGHLGDVPHTWIGAEYILAIASMIASERESKNHLVLAGGIPWAWVEEDQGMHLRDWPTRYGMLHMTLRAGQDDDLLIEIKAGLEMPTDGIILQAPCPPGMRYDSIAIKQGACEIDVADSSLHIRLLPFHARLIYQHADPQLEGRSS
ncbi:MAG: hypothetical protein RI957_176 [Verrucomicrobiota bacterium]|jgi:hypothetical protein